MGNAGKAVLAVVVLLAAGGIYYSLKPEKLQERSQYRVYCADLKSGAAQWVDYDADEQPPFVNPETGDRTLYPLYFSYAAERGFIPQLIERPGSPPLLPTAFKDPISDSYDYEQYDPATHDALAKGPVWLPKLKHP